MLIYPLLQPNIKYKKYPFQGSFFEISFSMKRAQLKDYVFNNSIIDINNLGMKS